MHERRKAERRQILDRRAPGAAVDVMRIEHENLYDEVGEVLRMLRRMEGELHEVSRRLVRLEESHVEVRRA